MNFCYSIFAYCLFFIFLYLSYRNRHFFVYIYFNFIFFTHIVGIILAEFLGIIEIEHLKNIYGYKLLNGASVVYLLFTILINLVFLTTINNFKAPLYKCEYLVKKLYTPNINFTFIYIFLFFIPMAVAYLYIYIYGNIPLLNGATDAARVEGDGLSNLFHIMMTVFFPILASILILIALVNKKLCYVDLTFIMLIIYPILMVHKSAIITVLFYTITMVILYYGYNKIKLVLLILALFILSFFLILMFFHFSEKFGLYDIILKFIFRLFVGQGSNFYLIWTDFINDKLPYIYDFSFLNQAFYSSFLQDLFGEYIYYKKFEYEVALYYTSDWFANSWNLVTTTLGEAVFTLGIIGVLFILILITIYIYMINFLFKKFTNNGNIGYLGSGLLLIAFLNSMWNMGGYYQLFSINNFILFIIFYFFFFLINFLLKVKIVISN